jgi:hypothetical protein
MTAPPPQNEWRDHNVRWQDRRERGPSRLGRRYRADRSASPTTGRAPQTKILSQSLVLCQSSGSQAEKGMERAGDIVSKQDDSSDAPVKKVPSRIRGGFLGRGQDPRESIVEKEPTETVEVVQSPATRSSPLVANEELLKKGQTSWWSGSWWPSKQLSGVLVKTEARREEEVRGAAPVRFAGCPVGSSPKSLRLEDQT